MNFRQTSLYRTYNHSVVPTYLQGRPRSTILYCLHRKVSSNKFCCNDIHDVDRQLGVFEVKGKNHANIQSRFWYLHRHAIMHFSEQWRLDLGQTSRCLLELRVSLILWDESALTSYLSSDGRSPGAEEMGTCIWSYPTS